MNNSLGGVFTVQAFVVLNKVINKTKNSFKFRIRFLSSSIEKLSFIIRIQFFQFRILNSPNLSEIYEEEYLAEVERRPHEKPQLRE
jgi:hypothetical protein